MQAGSSRQDRGCTDGRVDGRVDGHVDGHVDRVDGRVDGCWDERAGSLSCELRHSLKGHGNCETHLSFAPEVELHPPVMAASAEISRSP